MSLFRYETEKHFTRFSVILATVMLLINVGMVTAETGKQWKNRDEINEAIQQVHMDYRTDPEAVDGERAESESKIREAVWGGEPYHNKRIDLSEYGDKQLWEEIDPILERVKGFRRDINKVTDSAVRRAIDPDTKPGSYVYQYQLELIAHYRPLEELEIPAEP